MRIALLATAAALAGAAMPAPASAQTTDVRVDFLIDGFASGTELRIVCTPASPADCLSNNGGSSFTSTPVGPTFFSLTSTYFGAPITVGQTIGFRQGNESFGPFISGSFVALGNGAFRGISASIFTESSTFRFGALGATTSTLSTTQFSVRQISPAPVPEPATWATMLAGFGLVGGALRARRARPQLA